MDSIAPHKGGWQAVKARRPEVYKSGIRLHRQAGMVYVGSHLSGEDKAKRGEITEFTAGARRRLRGALLEFSIPDALRVGITLTVPWRGTDFTPLMDEFRACIHRFQLTFLRRFPNSAYIYRVELQTRGAPHIHALAYISRDDLAGVVTPAVRCATAPAMVACVCFEVRQMWLQAVPDLHHGSYGAFCEHGALVEEISTDGAMMRYVADHTSKSKQAQLGYKGKQWGIIGRRNLVKAESSELPPLRNDYQWAVFLRMLRKVVRYRITCDKWHRPPPFGCVYRGRKRMLGDFFVSDREIWRMYNFASRVVRPDCSTWNKC